MNITNLITLKIQFRYLLSIVVVCSVPLNSFAGEDSMEMKPMQGGTAPANARDPYASSNGYEYRGMAGWEDTDEMVVSKIIIEQLEYRNGDKQDQRRWDIQGWSGTDYHKFWFKFEGEIVVEQTEGDIELQTLYSTAVSAYWDMQFGARFDHIYGSGTDDNRAFAVFGFQGLAPYWFELESAIYVDKNGKVAARLTTSYDLLFTQKLILQPRFELNVSASNVPKFGVGKGVNDLQLGLRLRYEFSRKIAPYFGIAWQKQYSKTADFTLADGGIVSDTQILAGIRLWY